MQNKVLFCATVDYHFKAFHLPYLKWFQEQGWEVHIAASGDLQLPYVDKKYSIPIQRSPFHIMNLKAYKELKEIIDENQYKIIHCHTPMGGVLTRVAARNARRRGTKVIYTAHGFHFCKGAPAINWLLYYPIEKVLSSFTDCLITINQEDYKLAKLHRFKAKSIKHVHGVGVDAEIYKPAEESKKNSLRESLGYKPDDFLMFYAAEFNINKNQRLLIEALALIIREVPTARLLLAGNGSMKEECKNLSKKLGVDNNVDFLGFRTDINQLLKISDIAVASSLREGLPVNIMEAMACGLPVIASDNRGHKELVFNDKNGWVIKSGNSVEISHKMKFLANNVYLRQQLGGNGRKIILQNYSIQKVLEEQTKLYKDYMHELEGVIWATP